MSQSDYWTLDKIGQLMTKMNEQGCLQVEVGELRVTMGQGNPPFIFQESENQAQADDEDLEEEDPTVALMQMSLEDQRGGVKHG